MTEAEKMLTMVIPVRDRRELVGATLDCVEAALRVARFDVVVVDNGSTDGTPEAVAQRLAAMRQVAGEGVRLELLSEPSPGACAARNCGLRATLTPYVMFFDSDDRFDPDLPARIIEMAASASAAPDLIAWEVDYTDGRRMPPTSRCLEPGHHLFHASLATQRYAARTELVRRVGGWNETLPVWNDLEMGMRLLGAHPRVGFLDGEAPAVHILRHDASITGARFSNRPGQRERSLDAIEAGLVEAGRADMLPLVAARRLILADTYRREGATEAASALRRRVAESGFSPAVRLRLRIVAAIQRLLGRGGSAAALKLLASRNL